jgi:hypothetical protein
MIAAMEVQSTAKEGFGGHTCLCIILRNLIVGLDC